MSAQRVLPFNAETFSLTIHQKNLTPGWYTGGDEKGVKRLKIFFDSGNTRRLDFRADSIACNEGEKIDTTASFFPKNEVEVYFSNGRLNAKGALFPVFKRRFEKTEMKPLADTLYDYDSDGNAILLSTVTPQFVYSKKLTSEFYLIPYGKWTFYDAKGNLVAEKYFGKKDLYTSIYQYMNYKSPGVYEISPCYSSTKSWQNNYDPEDKNLRQEKLYHEDTFIEECKIYNGDVLLYHRFPTGVNRCKEVWYSSMDNGILKEINFVNDHIEGKYFRRHTNGDTLESGYYKAGKRHGEWKTFDSLAQPLFLGAFENGNPVGVHRFYANGVLYKSTEYAKYNRVDSLPEKRFNKFEIEKGNTYEYSDSIVYSPAKTTLYIEGKARQIILYDPYHHYDYWHDENDCNVFQNNNRYGILDGVYIPEKFTQIKIPDFQTEVYNHNEERGSIFRKYTYDENGKIIATLNYKKGNRDNGHDLNYHPNGQLKSSSKIKDGTLYGPSICYNSKGDTIFYAYHTNEGLHGLYIENETREHYYHGVMMGPFKKVYAYDGNCTSGNKFWGKEHGWQRNFDRKMRLTSEGKTIYGYKDSIWTYYDTLGQITKTEDYILGNLKSTDAKIQSYHVNSHYATAVFGRTVPEGKTMHYKNFFQNDSSFKESTYCQDCWENYIPENIDFKAISNHEFVVLCKSNDLLKFGTETTRNSGEITYKNYHRAHKDSVYYFWIEQKGTTVEAYKIKLAPDFRFVETDSISGEKQHFFENEHGIFYSGTMHYYRTGKTTVYYANGKIKAEYNAATYDIRYDGDSTQTFYPSGKLKFSGMFFGNGSDRIGIGTHYLYKEDGTLEEKRIFSDTNLTVLLFGKNNTLLFTGEYANRPVRNFYLYDCAYYNIPVYVSYPKNGEHRYFDNKGKEIQHEYYSMGKLIFKKNAKTIPLGKWKSLPLEGCDATSFFIDEKGHYWLGTGSSGGVYFSSDKGSTWKTKNKGIGPQHIERIGKYKDSLFIVIPGITKNIDSKIYLWKNKEWIFLNTAENRPEIIAALDENVNKNSLKIPFTTEIGKEEYASYWDHAGRFLEKYISAYFKQVKAEDSTLILPISFAQPGGNYMAESDSSGVLYGKSGVYYCTKDSIYNKKTKGLNATDAREVISDKNKSIWAIIGLGDVWKYAEGKWTLVFDFANHKDKKIQHLKTATTLTEMEEGIFFCAHGKVWKIQGDSATIFSQENWPINNIVSFSGQSEKYFFIHGYQTFPDDNEEEAGYKVFLFSENKFNRISLKGTQQYLWRGLLKTSPTKESWLFNGKNIYNLSNGEFYEIDEQSGITLGTNLIAFNSLGNMVYGFNADELILYSKGKGFSRRKVAHLDGLISLALDDNGKIFGGTGFDYVPACGVWVEGNAHGLFILDENNLWVELKNNINPWIMSLSFLDKNTLMVGTSGTGLYLYHLKDLSLYSSK